MLNKSEVSAYLSRLNSGNYIDNTLDTLKNLHVAHMLNIPFENLDIRLKQTIFLTSDAVVDKLLEKHRGGFCYELNYAFSLLLEYLGFNVKLLSARVFNGKEYGPALDHMLILVDIAGQQYIADVGFGDSFREPLLISNAESKQLDALYKIEKCENYYILFQKKGVDIQWQPQYKFNLSPHVISDFNDMCIYQQTSPNSHFTKKSLCSIATVCGRATLSNNRLIVSSIAHRTEEIVTDKKAYMSFLYEYFQINSFDEDQVEVLLNEQL